MRTNRAQSAGEELTAVRFASSTFNQDFGVTPVQGDEDQGVSIFLRDGDNIYHTYQTGGRGGDHLLLTYANLDLTPYGRQESWEDSPPGWPQQAG